MNTYYLYRREGEHRPHLLAASSMAEAVRLVRHQLERQPGQAGANAEVFQVAYAPGMERDPRIGALSRVTAR